MCLGASFLFFGPGNVELTEHAPSFPLFPPLGISTEWNSVYYHGVGAGTRLDELEKTVLEMYLSKIQNIVTQCLDKPTDNLP